jgi:hypothetical protein
MTDNPILTAEQVAEIRKSADEAFRHVCDLAAGRKKWRMCVPVNPDDSDVVLGKSTGTDIPALCDTVDTLRARVAELERDAEIARLAREYVAARNETTSLAASLTEDRIDEYGQVRLTEYRLHRALIAAVERENRGI